MDVFTTIIIVVTVIWCIVHVFFLSAAGAGMRWCRKGDLSDDITEQLSFYRDHEASVQATRHIEQLATVAWIGLLAYTYTMSQGWIPVDAAMPEALLWLLPGVCVFIFMVLLDGFSVGICRRVTAAYPCKYRKVVEVMYGLWTPARKLYTLLVEAIGGEHKEKASITEEDIMQMVDVGNESGVIESEQRDYIDRIFRFDDRSIEDVMTHRKEVVAIDAEMSIEEVVELARNEQYSRMPVYEDNIDHIIGIINVKDLLGLIGCTNISGFHVRHFLRDAMFVSETAKCDDVLTEMSKKKMQMAIVVDEYGGTTGIVCMEDILEQLVGEIQDEYDDEEQDVRKISENTYVIDGNANPEDTLPILGLELPEDDEAGTMSSFVVERLGYVPKPSDMPYVEWNHVRFTVLRMEDNWISRIKAEILPHDT